MIYYTLGIFLVICSVTGAWQVLGGSVKEKEKWIEPNAWAKEVEALPSLDNGFCTCNAEGKTGDVSGTEQAAAFVLKKFVRQLFNREKLQYDEQFSLYQRRLLFTVVPAQLELLERLDDPRDLDSVLTEIFNNVRTLDDYKNNGSWSRIFALIWDILKDCVLLLRFSEVRFISFVVLIIIAGWFIHRKHNISIIVMILGGFFLFGYFHTYLECNRELEMKQMVEAIEHTERILEPPEPRWYTPITSWFGSSPQEIVKKNRHEKIKKESRLNLSFCRPDHVLIMYMNDIFIKQLEFLIEKCIASIVRVKENLGFWEGSIAVVGLIALLISVIKLTFEHVLSPRVWIGYFRGGDSTPAANVRPSQQALPENNEDRLSGENLKILLQAISMPKSNLATNTPAISCAQDVLEPLEALKAPSDDCDSSSSSNTSVNKNSSQNLVFNSEADLSENTCTISALIGEAILEQGSSRNLANQSDSDFVIVSEVKSKVLLEDVPNDHD